MDNLLWYKGHKILIDSVSKTEGVFVYGNDGRRFVDMESGVWCLPLGHGSQVVIDALHKQANKCMHTGYCYTDSIVNEAAGTLLRSAGLEGGKCAFLQSGSESVEVGVQAVKLMTEKKYLLTFDDSFLGSHGSASEKSSEEWHLFNWQMCSECSESKCSSCKHFKTIPIEDVAGFVFEPGSSSGFVRFPPSKLIDAIYAELQNNHAFYHVNEVTTGIGRTGKMYGYMYYNPQPDIVSIGKGVGNGYPVSAVMFSSAVAGQLDRTGFSLSQSHQNDPAGAAVAVAVMGELEKQNLVQEAFEKGGFLIGALKDLQAKHSCIAEVRGRGLMITITFQNISDESLIKLHKKIFDGGYITVKRPEVPVLRIDPPLIITYEHLAGFVSLLDELLFD